MVRVSLGFLCYHSDIVAAPLTRACLGQPLLESQKAELMVAGLQVKDSWAFPPL